MTDAATRSAAAETEKASWGDLLRGGRAVYTVLIILGATLQALQMLVMVIIMPTVVADIGGAAYYTWPSMLYTIGAIVGGASVGPLWAALGVRRGYGVSAIAFLAGTVGCAVAPDVPWLIAARGVQGLAGGLVVGGGMALISAMYGAALRTRILALFQAMWMVAQLLGPVLGGVFAEIGWWRGSFWSMVPIILCFGAIAWFRLPDRLESEVRQKHAGRFPVMRLAMLTGGVFCIAAAGPAENTALRVGLIVAAIGLIWLTFRRDRVAANRLYPSTAMSVTSPVGLALWILFLVGMVQTTVSLFLPLLLQVVHGVTPLYVSFVGIVVSAGWTIGTFVVSGWSGAKERFALWGGPLFMLAGLAGITVTAETPLLAVLTLAAFVLGFGAGIHNVHLLARTMAAADAGEESITAAALPSIRSLGIATGAALGGMLAGIAGLGAATEPDAVGAAVSFVYACGLLPLAIAALFMFRLVRLGVRPAADGEGD